MDFLYGFAIGVVISAISIALVLRNNPRVMAQIDVLAKQVEALAKEIKK